jgi:hypothetical protein
VRVTLLGFGRIGSLSVYQLRGGLVDSRSIDRRSKVACHFRRAISRRLRRTKKPTHQGCNYFDQPEG